MVPNHLKVIIVIIAVIVTIIIITAVIVMVRHKNNPEINSGFGLVEDDNTRQDAQRQVRTRLNLGFCTVLRSDNDRIPIEVLLNRMQTVIDVGVP